MEKRVLLNRLRSSADGPGASELFAALLSATAPLAFVG
jgi:hypothetical protein